MMSNDVSKQPVLLFEVDGPVCTIFIIIITKIENKIK